MDIDKDAAIEPLSKRERLCIKLVLLVIGMCYPSKYEHQIKAFLDEIKREF